MPDDRNSPRKDTLLLLLMVAALAFVCILAMASIGLPVALRPEVLAKVRSDCEARHPADADAAQLCEMQIQTQALAARNF